MSTRAALAVPGRAAVAVAALLTLLAVALHGWRLEHAGALWGDEAGAARMATLPSWGEVFERFPHEAFPLGFVALVRTVVGLAGESDEALRLLGTAIGLGVIGALWVSARAGGALPLFSLALFALQPNLLVYGDSLRGYGLATLLVILTGAAYGRLVVHPDRRAVFVAALAATASVHSALQAAALVVALALAAALVTGLRRRWWAASGALGSGLVATLSLLPYLGPLEAALPWHAMLRSPFGPRDVLAVANGAIHGPGPNGLAIWVGVLCAACCVAVVSERRAALAGATATADALRFRCLAILLAGAAQYVFFVLVVGYLPRPWYFLTVLGLWASCADVLLAPPRRAGWWALSATALLVALVQAPVALAETRARMTNVDAVARLLAARATPSDLVVVNPWYFGISFDRYYRGPAPWETVPVLADHRFHRLDLFRDRMVSPLPLADLREAIARTLRGGGRVWLVGWFQPDAPGSVAKQPPPAPHPDYGWADGPYVNAWSKQVSDLLRRGAASETVALEPVGRVHRYEALTVRAFSGWRGATPFAARIIGASAAR